MTKEQRERLERLSTTNISDALDAFGLRGATYGILPVWEGCRKIVGEAITLRLISAGTMPPKTHLGVKAIEVAKKGDIIVIDNAGRTDVSCWGGVLSTGACLKGISGVVIDGACRDIDDYIDLNFSVYSRGPVVATARGRVIEESTNEMIQFGGVQVHPGDIVMADRSGVVIIPKEQLEKIVLKAEELFQKEENMCADLRRGMTNAEVDKKYNYEVMIKK